MKSAVSLLIIVFMALSLKAQDMQTSVKGSINPFTIEAGFEHTTNLIFPYSVKSVDKGNSEVLVQKAKGVENVLQVKAGMEGFTATNLTVITGEGSLYSFMLQYSPHPVKLNHRVAELTVPVEQSVIFSEAGNEAALKDAAKRIAAKKRFMQQPKDWSYETGMELQGIYIAGNTLYFQLLLQNNSNINYDIDQFRIFIRDRKITKRTAAQEIAIEPLYVEGNAKRIEGASGQTIVVALEKFTIPDKKHLTIQLMERNGGRNLSIRLKNKHIVQAKQI